MFHQVCLLPEDCPLLRFLWHDLKVDEPPGVFKWQVLPFGTTSTSITAYRVCIYQPKPSNWWIALEVFCLQQVLSCNEPGVSDHLPQEAQSHSLDPWLAQDKANPQEFTMGRSWNWERDSLSYKHRPVSYDALTLRNIYKVLASQYDPFGCLLPFSTRAKLVILKPRCPWTLTLRLSFGRRTSSLMLQNRLTELWPT